MSLSSAFELTAVLGTRPRAPIAQEGLREIRLPSGQADLFPCLLATSCWLPLGRDLFL